MLYTYNVKKPRKNNNPKLILKYLTILNEWGIINAVKSGCQVMAHLLIGTRILVSGATATRGQLRTTHLGGQIDTSRNTLDGAFPQNWKWIINYKNQPIIIDLSTKYFFS